jgi:hypothetical protein
VKPPEKTKPLPGQLGGTTGQGLQDSQGRPRGRVSVPVQRVEGCSPSGDAVEGEFGCCGTGDRAGVVGRAHPPTPPTPTALVEPVEGAGLPCLSSNNSIEATGLKRENPTVDLSPQQKKSACALAWNVQAMASRWGLERLGFLTLTFAEHITDPKEAQRRLNSLSSNVLRERYPDGFIRVYERQKSGRIHYHLLVVLPHDVRTGADFEAFSEGDYRTASTYLRKEWSFWRKTAKTYGFGRTELMPVRSTEEGIGRYVGKYIGKHHASRKEEDKGVRLVEYSRGGRIATTRFGWSTENAAQWRAKVRLFAQIMQQRLGVEINELSDLTPALGPRWAYHHRDFIYSLPVMTPEPGRGILSNGDHYDPKTGEILTR